jgi:hypothetical protein
VLPVQERLVIAIDAVDEADPSSYPPGANLLYLPSALPDSVYFVLSRRHGTERLLDVESPLVTFDLDAHASASYSDIRKYVLEAAQNPAILNWLSARELSPESLADTASSKSEGNFMYARYLMARIAAGDYDDFSDAMRPSTLQEHYEVLWRRMGMTAQPLPHDKLRVLYVLSQARSPVSLDLLTSLIGDLDANRIRTILIDLQPFLSVDYRGDAPIYSLFHRTFADFLQRRDIMQAADVSAEKINSDIADSLWRGLAGRV